MPLTESKGMDFQFLWYEMNQINWSDASEIAFGCVYVIIRRYLILSLSHQHSLVCFLSFILSFGINWFVPVSRAARANGIASSIHSIKCIKLTISFTPDP
jgi:hypothetical protein